MREADKVAVYAGGVDDYVEKLFSFLKPLARIRVTLRRAVQNAQLNSGGQFSVANIKVNFASRRVTLDGRNVHLFTLEYRVLAALVKHAGKVMTHRQLLADVWGPSYVEHSHYLRIYMGSLRRKLEEDPARPKILFTETGTGYRLAGDAP